MALQDSKRGRSAYLCFFVRDPESVIAKSESVQVDRPVPKAQKSGEVPRDSSQSRLSLSAVGLPNRVSRLHQSRQ